MNANSITIYTDGSCDPNPGPGGWAALLISNGTEELISGSSIASTNNRMELTAAIKAIQKVEVKQPITIYTDSQYLKNGITVWMKNWIARNWKRKGGKLANVDLWQELSRLIEKHQINWQWVKSHSGNRYNELVDRRAKQEAYLARKKR